MKRPIVLLASALVLIASTARATPNFPSVVQSHLGLATTPDCTLCHNGTPGRGTVTTPFGTSMRSRGAAAYDESSIATALDALDGERKDSDGDGTPDIAELKAGTDPNASPGETVVPDYGCGVRGGAAGSRAAWLAGAIGLLLARRRARRVVAARS